jgi:hypothetical protein
LDRNARAGHDKPIPNASVVPCFFFFFIWSGSFFSIPFFFIGWVFPFSSSAWFLWHYPFLFRFD